MTAFLAIDQGTSSSRALVFAADGRLLGLGQVAFDMQFPADGWVEQNPEVLWQTTLQAIAAALGEAKLSADAITAIGITNQRETTLLWDRASGECLHPAIVWQDRRTAPRCAELEAAGHAARIRELTGLVVDPYFSATKLAWMLEQIPGAKARAERGELCFGTVDSFLIYRLTGGASHVTDATNASRTQLYDLRRADWSDELLALHGIPRALLPDVRDCVSDFGVTDPQQFGAAVPILGVAGDQQAALLGNACIEPGMTKSTYGTGCFLIANTGAELVTSHAQLLGTVGYRLNGQTQFALEGSIFVAGVAVKWLRDNMGLIEHAADTEALARSIAGDTNGVYVVPAFTGLGAPYWQPAARGLITGLTLDSSRAQLVTATVASVAYMTAALTDALAADGVPVAALRVDGGMVVNNWLCEFLADMVAAPVERPQVTETTALGAALLAGIGAGEHASLEQAASMWQLERRFEPSMQASQRERLRAGWQQAIDQALTSQPH